MKGAPHPTALERSKAIARYRLVTSSPKPFHTYCRPASKTWLAGLEGFKGGAVELALKTSWATSRARSGAQLGAVRLN